MFVIKNNKVARFSIRCFDSETKVEKLFVFEGGSNKELSKDDLSLLVNHPMFRLNLDNGNFSWYGKNVPEIQSRKQKDLFNGKEVEYDFYFIKGDVKFVKASDIESDNVVENALSALNAPEAIELVEKTFDAEQLKKWLKDETRKGVSKAIEKQLKSFSILSYEIANEKEAIEYVEKVEDEEILNASLEKEDRENVKSLLLDKLKLAV